MSLKAKWVCCQIGAREHYAVPRVVHSIDSLGGLITESWVPPGHPVSSVRRLGERFHPDLGPAPVYAWNSAAIAFEISARVQRLGGWPLTIKRNLWFQQRGVKMLQRLAPQLERNGNRTILFAYSYAALELLRFARTKGWQTVLGQIDGGLRDEEVVANEHRQHAGLTSHWQPAPPAYWRSWQEECSLADTIIVNSTWSKELLSDAGVDAAKLKVIPVAYQGATEARELERSYPAEFSAARPLRVLFLGAFALRKGAAAVLEAMRLLEEAPVEFWIVGALGVDVPAALRESAKVKWVGAVSRESTADYYRNADLFLFPTISDGFGMTQVEARGWKLPVIATPFCAPIIEHERNGLIIEEVNGAALSSAIRYLLDSPAHLKRLSAGYAGEYDAYSVASVREEILSLGS